MKQHSNAKIKSTSNKTPTGDAKTKNDKST